MDLHRTGIVVLSLLLMGTSMRVQATCDQPVSTAELAAFVEQAEQSVGRDARLFGQAVGKLEDSLPCVDGLIGPELAARIHRAQGLRSFVAGAGEHSIMAFAAARRIEPGFRFPESVFPSAHPVPQLYERAAEVAWQVEPLVAPQGSTLLWLDGVVRSERPVVAPVVAQYQRDGDLVLSAYVWPEDDLPAPPPAPQVALRPERRELEHSILVPKQRRAHLPLVVGAGLTALAGAGSYALAYTTARDYRDNPHSDAELEQLRGRANSLVYVSVGLASVAVGTGVGAAVTWPR